MSDNLKKKLLALKCTKPKTKKIEEFHGDKLFLYENDFLAIGNNDAVISGMRYDQDVKKEEFKKYPNLVFTEKIGSRIPEFNMIFCQKGSFVMRKEALLGKNKSLLEREVTLTKSFLLGETKVSQELFESIMKDLGDGIVKEWNDFKKYAESGDLGKDKPMFSLTWFEALLFCNALSERKGLQPCYKLTPETFQIDPSNNEDYDAFGSYMTYRYQEIKSYKVTKIENANGYRLPTEAEWEYAALANSESMLYPENVLDYIAHSSQKWIDEYGMEEESISMANNKETTKPNPWGFYDLLGNTYEFCEDDCDFDETDFIGGREDELKALLKTRNVDPCSWSEYPYYIDADGKRQFTKKRVRGLSYDNIDEDAIITIQYHRVPPHRNQTGFEKYVGIRLARTIL